MASAKELKIIKEAKNEFSLAQKKKDTAAMAAAHLKADKARGYSTVTKQDEKGNYYQSVKSATPPTKPTPKIPLATQIRTGTQKTTTPIAPKKNLLEEAFDKNENYVEKAKKGNLSGAAANFVGTGLTGAQSLYLNAINTADSVLSGKGIPKQEYQFSAKDYGKAVAERRGEKPLSNKISEKNKTLGSIYDTAMEIGTDPLELTPLGYANDIKLARGVNQNSLAYAKALQSAKLAPSETIIPRNTDAPRSRTVSPVVIKNTPVQPQTRIQSEVRPQAPIASVQPRNTNLGMSAPQRQAFAENVNLPKTETLSRNPLIRDLGADTNKTLPEYNVSKVRTNTIENSPMFEKAKSYMEEPDYTYEVVSEKRSLEQAKQRLGTDFDGEVEDLPTKANFDGVDMDTAMGIMENYIKEAEQTGNYTRAKEWSRVIREKGTQGGQLIQSFAKYSRTPEGAVIKAQQTIDKVEKGIKETNPNLIKEIDDVSQKINDFIKKGNFTDDEIEKALNKITNDKQRKMTLQEISDLSMSGNATPDAVRDIIKSKYGVPTITELDMKNILENMKLSETATDPYMKKMYASRAEQIISDKTPAEFREKFRALQRLSLILNPKTLITRNPLGNTILGVAENVKDLPGAALDKAISMRTGERTTAFAPIAKTKAQLQGFGQGAKEWAQDIKYGVDTSPSRGQFELPSGRVFKNPTLNTLDQFERKALQLGDRPFYQSAYNGRIAELKKLGKVGEEAELDARLYALDRVFQNNSELSKRAVQIRKTLGLPGDLIMPFTQTPANILDKLIDYSPAGLIKAVVQLGTTAGKGTFNQKKFVDTLARTFTGGGIAMLTYAMMEKGILSGSLSDNMDVRQAEQLQGKQYYSIKIDGKWYSYDWAQPIAGIMAATADAIKAGATKDDFAEALIEGGSTAIDSVFNQSFLSGILTAFSGYSPAAGIGAALLGSTSQATPSAGANLAKVIDPTVRETYDPNTLKQQANKLIARIPLASKTLPAKVDVKGEEIKQSQGRGLGARAFENFLAPYRLSEETGDKVNTELMRLQSQTGDNAVLLNKTPKGFEKDSKKYIFKSGDYIQYQKTVGQQAYKNIETLIKSSEYAKLTDEEKANKVKDIHNNAILNARAEYFKNQNLSPLLALDKSQREKYLTVKELGVNEDQYLNSYNAAKDIDSTKDDFGKTIYLSESYNKKQAIDKANPNTSIKELRALYYAFGVSEKVW